MMLIVLFPKCSLIWKQTDVIKFVEYNSQFSPPKNVTLKSLCEEMAQDLQPAEMLANQVAISPQRSFSPYQVLPLRLYAY